KETVLDNNPPMSTRRRLSPTVAGAKEPPILKLPLASVLLQSDIFQELPLLEPRRCTVVFGTPLIAFRVQEPPGQNRAADKVNTGTRGPQWRSLFGIFTVVGFPVETMKVLYTSTSSVPRFMALWT